MKPIYPQVPIKPIPAVMPKPQDPYTAQFDIFTALAKGTLFSWLYDPYQKVDY